MARRTLESLVFVALLSLAGAQGAEPPAVPWQTLPIWGADVRSIAVQPGDPNLVLAGTSAGQVYLSRDAGRSWAPAGPSVALPGWVIGHLEFDPNHPTRIWAALWGIWGGGHVVSSDDLGRTWAARATRLPDQPVYTLALIPGKPGWIYAATIGGVFGSTDEGASWALLTAALPEIQKVTSLWIDPNRPETVIAGTWRRAYRSEDGGRTWNGVFEGMVLDSEVFSLTSIPNRPDELWASTCGWVYRSANRGTSWERFQQGFQERRTTSFTALPGGRLLAGTVAGLHLSDDNGKTWRRVGDPGVSILAIAYHPAQPDRIYFGTEGSGLWVSTDNGETLYPSTNGMTNVRISTLSAVGNELLVGVTHAGPFSGLHRSPDRGRSFKSDFATLPPVLDLATHRGRLFAATERGIFERRGSGWHWMRDLGEARVEELIEGGPRLAARTPDRLYELGGKGFAPRPFKHGVPRSAAYLGNSLWVTDSAALYRLAEGTNHTLETPFPGGRVARIGDRLIYWGLGGAFTRSGDEAPWNPLTSGPTRFLATADGRFPALLIAGESVQLFDSTNGTFTSLAVPIPARDVSAALVLDGRLFLGTSGYGLLVRDL
jgi:photosystem II stability/assembly factor-like uncharacterized protein